MKRIQKLSETLVSQIAAGEVIESPAAIIKELVENSLDAGADAIDIRVAGDGFTEIQVRDNGHGIDAEDLPLAVESFTTSKIATIEELLAARTMGFRGEALGSIASVSRLTIESRARGAAHGSFVSVDESGKQVGPSAIEAGTRVIVRDLFYNIPVRREYFANLARVRKDISAVLTNFAAANYRLNFSYRVGDDTVVLYPCDNLIKRLSELWGEQIGRDLLPVYEESGALSLSGYISKFYFYRSGATDCRFWVNNRPVLYKPLISLLRHIYGELMPKGRFPFTALFLTLPATDVDVNVHPQKREVRFRHETEVTAFLRQALSRVVSAQGGISAGNMVNVHRAEAKSVKLNEKADSGPVAAENAQLFNVMPALFTEPGAPLRFPERLALHSRIFNTFVIATNDEALFLIDQHTVHERINYERQLSRIASRGELHQLLAHSLPLASGIFDRQRIREALPVLEKLGFYVEDLGPAGFALTAVPDYVEAGEEVAAFGHALSISEKAGSLEPAQLFDQLAKDLSCRLAIKKGESASLADFDELLKQLRNCEQPMRCPHGRPTIVRIEEAEIFAYFKRQV